MSEHHRPDDHLVEPIFAALREVDPAQPTRPRRLGLALFVLAVVAAIWWITVGA